MEILTFVTFLFDIDNNIFRSRAIFSCKVSLEACFFAATANRDAVLKSSSRFNHKHYLIAFTYYIFNNIKEKKNLQQWLLKIIFYFTSAISFII